MTGLAIVLFVYASIIEVDGVLALKTTGKQGPLLAALIKGFFLYVAAALVWMGIALGFYLGLVVTMVLVALFGRRFGQTQQFIPSGLGLVISVVVLGILVSIVV
jgi:uncharacterized membrane protein (UPF0136 family)